MPRILALDYGERRIGIALSDEAGIIAMPFRTINALNREQALSEIGRICNEKKVFKIIVGMPLNMNGDKGTQAERASAFALNIGKQLGIPVETWDERLSTRMAERTLISADVSRNKRKGVIDRLAAQIILQSYLDAQ